MSKHTGYKIPISAYLTDANGTPQTGKSVKVKIIQIRSGADTYWSGTAWGTTPIGLTLSQIDVTNLPGFYLYELDTGQVGWTALGPVEMVFAQIYEGVGPVLDSYEIDFSLDEDYYLKTIVEPKLPTNYIMGSGVLTDKDDEIDAISIDTGTNIPATLTTIDGKIDAIDSEIGVIDGIVDDIKQSIIVGSGVVQANGSTTIFQTDLPGLDDYWNDLQILMVSGSNAGQARRISNFVDVNGIVTVDSVFKNSVALNDTFILIGRFTSAASALTPASIATAVWESLLSGHITPSTFGLLMQDIKTVLDSVQSDTNDIQTRIPITLLGGLMRAHVQDKDATLALSAQEKIDVNAEIDQALIDYGGATSTELGVAETNIIAEIDDNEAKIDIMQIDLTLLLTRLGIPPTTIYDALKAEIDANEALILTLTGNLVTHDSAIKGLIGTPIIDLITDINNRFDTVDTNIQANYDSIILIQNNVSTVLTGPKKLVRPDSGTKPYRYFVFNYDNIGNMEDFNADPTLTGTYISGGGPYFGGTMVHDGIGQYHFDVDVAFDDTLGAIQAKLDAVIAGTLAPRVMSITSEVSDYDDELAEIKADTEQIISDVANVDADLIAHDDHLNAVEIALTAKIDANQTIIETIRDDATALVSHANPAIINTGYSLIESDVDILPGATLIPIIPSTDETFNLNGGFIKLDKGEVTEEVLIYTGIVNDNIILSSPTLQTHEPGTTIHEVTRLYFNITIRRKNGQPNIQADSAPIFLISPSIGGTDGSGSMVWNAGKAKYIGYVDYDLETEPGERIGHVTVIVDSVTRDYPFNFELLDRPSSERQINEAVGSAIPPGTFVFDHDGWVDEFGVKHLWTDEMAGSIKDDAGQPLICLIKAYLYDPIDVNVPILGPNPPYDNYTNQFGHYVGGLSSGKYLFTFIVNGKKWKQVDRMINYP